MKHYLPLLLTVLLLAAHPLAAAQAESAAAEAENCRAPGMKVDGDTGQPWCKNMQGSCGPEMRGRCGKRRGDWYGASQPVASAGEARKILTDHFATQGFTVSEIAEGRWGFRTEIVGKDGKVVDRVMIDKRSGRIRSIN